jgi:hypothetical protein
MRRFQRALTLLALCLLCCSCAATHPLAGRWLGKDAEGGEVMLFLQPNGQFEAIAKGERLVGQWKVDQTVEPNRIDLSFETRTFSSIMRVQGDSMLIEPVGEDGETPKEFSEKATYYQRQR